MKQITYAGQSILTSDEMASALIEYTAALARRQLAEAIEIPIVTGPESASRTAEMVVGMGSDLLATPAEQSAREPDFGLHVLRLREKLDRLNEPVMVVVPREVVPLTTTIDEFDI